jgi:hypothetical protein
MEAQKFHYLPFAEKLVVEVQSACSRKLTPHQLERITA